MTTGSSRQARVVLLQLRSQPPRFHAHDRIEPGIVAVAPVEDLQTEHVLLQLLGLARQRPLDHVAKKTRMAAARKGRGGQDALELCAHLVGGRRHGGSMDQGSGIRDQQLS